MRHTSFSTQTWVRFLAIFLLLPLLVLPYPTKSRAILQKRSGHPPGPPNAGNSNQLQPPNTVPGRPDSSSSGSLTDYGAHGIDLSTIGGDPSAIIPAFPQLQHPSAGERSTPTHDPTATGLASPDYGQSRTQPWVGTTSRPDSTIGLALSDNGRGWPSSGRLPAPGQTIIGNAPSGEIVLGQQEPGYPEDWPLPPGGLASTPVSFGATNSATNSDASAKEAVTRPQEYDYPEDWPLPPGGLASAPVNSGKASSARKPLSYDEARRALTTWKGPKDNDYYKLVKQVREEELAKKREETRRRKELEQSKMKLLLPPPSPPMAPPRGN